MSSHDISSILNVDEEQRHLDAVDALVSLANASSSGLIARAREKTLRARSMQITEKSAVKESKKKYDELPSDKKGVVINYIESNIATDKIFSRKDIAVYFYYTLEYLHCIEAVEITKRLDPPHNNQPIQFRVLDPKNPECKALEYLFIPVAGDDMSSFGTKPSRTTDDFSKYWNTTKKSADNRWKLLGWYLCCNRKRVTAKNPTTEAYTYPHPKCFTTPGVSENYVFEFHKEEIRSQNVIIGVDKYYDELCEILEEEWDKKNGLAISHGSGLVLLQQAAEEEEDGGGKRAKTISGL
jgi:hypothetical protein